MVKFSVVVLLALAAVMSASNAVKLDCEFQTLHGWNAVSSVDGAGSVYGGIIKNMKVTEKTIVTGVSGAHLYNNEDSGVIGLNIYEPSVCHIIPDGLGDIYKNLEAFAVWKSALKTVTSADLKQFPKLREIWLYENELQYLESNLFEFNPSLEYMNFKNNKIKFIGANFFNYLPKLSKAVFWYNVCINDEATDATQLEKIRNDIKTKCSFKDETTDEFGFVEGDNKLSWLHFEILRFRLWALHQEISLYRSTKGCSISIG